MTQVTFQAERQLVDRYVAEVNRHPLLSREEETVLAEELARNGDPALANRLVVANLRFVVKVAHEFRGYGVALLDLIQEGNVGLMLAVQKFDPYRGYRLISYAVWWIRAYIQSYIMRTWSMVKIGTTVAQRKLFFKLRSERQQLERSGLPGAEVEVSKLASNLGVNEMDINEMDLRLAARDFSLDAKIGDDGRQSFVDLLPDSENTPEDLVVEVEQRRQWNAKIAVATNDLDERERYILEARLRTDEPQTLREIGERFKISRERVRQIQESVLGKLRFALLDDGSATLAA